VLEELLALILADGRRLERVDAALFELGVIRLFVGLVDACVAAVEGELVGPYERNSIRPYVLASLRSIGEAEKTGGRRRETALR